MQFVDLTREYKKMQEEIDLEVSVVLTRGRYILGPQVEEFERRFAEYIKSPYAVGVNSGTDALFLSLKAYGIGSGDEVLTVSHTAAATISAIVMTGARPVYADILEKDMTMDPADAKKKITKKTKAIIPVHIYGYPCDMKAITGLAKKHRIKVIEDACQAHGAIYNGKKAGSFGDAACFSFYPTKNLGGYGDGGMVVTKDRIIAARIRAMRQYGWTGDRTDFVCEGINSRLSEMQAAILNVKLWYLDKENARRQNLAQIYKEELRGLPIILPSQEPKREHVYHLYVIRVKKREKLMQYLASRDIPVMIHYPYHMHKSKVYGVKGIRLPVTDKIQREILTLPLYAEMTEKEVRTVAMAIRGFHRGNNGTF